MEIRYLSPTKVKQYRTCPARLMSRIEDNVFEESGEPARMGTLAHEAAELWFDPEHRRAGLSPDPSVCFQHAMKRCREDKRKGLPRDAANIANAKRLFEAILAHYNRDVLNVVFAERTYKGALGNGVPVHLRVDMGVDGGGGKLRLIDYKTGFITLSDEEMLGEDQVLMNLLATHRDPTLQQWPIKSFEYFWTRHNYPSEEIIRSPQDLADYEYELSELYQEALNMTDPPERVNAFCGSCHRRTKCRAYREMLGEALGRSQALTDEEAEALSEDDLLSHHEKLKGQIKILESSLDTVKSVVQARMTAQRSEKFETDHFRASLVRRSTSSFDPQVLLKLTHAHGIAITDLFKPESKKRIEDRLADKTGAMRELEATMIRRKNNPYVNVSAIKKKTTKKGK